MLRFCLVDSFNVVKRSLLLSGWDSGFSASFILESGFSSRICIPWSALCCCMKYSNVRFAFSASLMTHSVVKRPLLFSGCGSGFSASPVTSGGVNGLFWSVCRRRNDVRWSYCDCGSPVSIWGWGSPSMTRRLGSGGQLLSSSSLCPFSSYHSLQLDFI